MAFDVIGPLPITDSGKQFILVLIDYYTKWAEDYDLSDHKAINAPEFRGHVLHEVKELLGVKGTFTTPYRPQANGLCECINQTIESILKTLIQDNRNQWDNDLAFSLMAYRATPHSTTIC